MERLEIISMSFQYMQKPEIEFSGSPNSYCPIQTGTSQISITQLYQIFDVMSMPHKCMQKIYLILRSIVSHLDSSVITSCGEFVFLIKKDDIYYTVSMLGIYLFKSLSVSSLFLSSPIFIFSEIFTIF